jgi:septation ring formation regulator EzrA
MDSQTIQEFEREVDNIKGVPTIIKNLRNKLEESNKLQKELEIQIDQLKKEVQLLEESNNKYKELFSTSLTAIKDFNSSIDK